MLAAVVRVLLGSQTCSAGLVGLIIFRCVTLAACHITRIRPIRLISRTICGAVSARFVGRDTNAIILPRGLVQGSFTPAFQARLLLGTAF